MQAVILAAGRGTRMGALTDDRPKPMIELLGKPLLEYKFDALPKDVDEIIIVIGYLGNVIQEKYGNSFNGRNIVYVVQENPTGGTAEALWKTKHLLRDTFLVLNGDDIYTAKDLEACRMYEWAVLVQRQANIAGGAKVVMDADNHVVDIIEAKYHNGGEGVVNTNTFVLDTRIFQCAPIPKAPDSAELGLPQSVLAASERLGIPLNVVEATGWIQLKDPNALAQAEQFLKDR